MPRSLDDVLNQTPLPPMASIANAASQGYASAQSWNMDPFQGLKISQNLNYMPPTSHMTPANMGVFRPGPVTPPPPLSSTAGMTGMFHDPYEMGLQRQVAGLRALGSPESAGAALGSRALSGFGSRWGGAIGTVGGLVLGGGAGASWGGMIGDVIGGTVMDNSLFRGAHNLIYGGALNQISNAANVQLGTMGNLSMGGGQMGLGGRGMNMGSALTLGNRLTRMGEQSGGSFNQVDMQNLTAAASSLGFLDQASNIDQIGDTIKKLMGVVGKMAKLTGDPDFRNNLREISNLKGLGFTVDQAVDAVSDMSTYARQAGMTRAQVTQVGQMGMSRFGAAGLVPGLGMTFGAHAAGQERMLRGTFSPMETALMGGQSGIRQRLIEGQAAFASGVGGMLLPNALTVGEGGNIVVDASRLQAMSSAGGLGNLQETIGQGAGNLQARASQLAAQTGRSFNDVMSEIMMNQKLYQSQAAQQMGAGGMQRFQLSALQSLSQQVGGIHPAAGILSGGDPNQARMLVGMATSSQFYERQKAQLEEQARRETSKALSAGRQARAAREEAMGFQFGDFMGDVGRTIAPGLSRNLGFLGRRYDRFQASSARDYAMEQEQSALAAQGLTGVVAGGSVNEAMVRELESQVDTTGISETGSNLAGAMVGSGGGLIMGADELTAGELEALEMQGVRGFGSGVRDFARKFNASQRFFGGGVGGWLRADQRIIQENKDRVRQVRKTADVIEKAKGRTLTQYYRSNKAAAKALERLGANAPEALSAVKAQVLEYARQQARDDKGVNAEDLLRAAKRSLSQYIKDPEKVDQMLERGKSTWLRHLLQSIYVSGDKLAKAAVEQTRGAGFVSREFDTEMGQEALDRMIEAREDLLDEVGVTEGGALLTGEKEALTMFQNLGSAEDQKAFLLMARGGEGSERLFTEASDDRMKQLVALKKRFGGLGEEGQGFLKNLGRAFQRSGDLGEQVRQARQGKGRFAALSAPERLMAQLRAQGIDTTATADLESMDAPAGPASEKAEKIRRDIKELEKIKQAFIGPEGAATALSNAASQLSSAAAKLNPSGARSANQYRDGAPSLSN